MYALVVAIVVVAAPQPDSPSVATSARAAIAAVAGRPICLQDAVGQALGFDAKERAAAHLLAETPLTVADIVMTTVLREARKSRVLGEWPRVSAYRERCEGRPAWERTLRAYEERLGVEPGAAR